jgi:hypothetical protein
LEVELAATSLAANAKNKNVMNAMAKRMKPKIERYKNHKQ